MDVFTGKNWFTFSTQVTRRSSETQERIRKEKVNKSTRETYQKYQNSTKSTVTMSNFNV